MPCLYKNLFKHFIATLKTPCNKYLGSIWVLGSGIIGKGRGKVDNMNNWMLRDKEK